MKIFAIITLALLFPVFVSAQGGFIRKMGENLGTVEGVNFSQEFLYKLLDSVACKLIQFAVVAITVMIVVYGIMFLLSRGEPQAFTNAKKALLWGMVGGLVIFGVTSIILTVAGIIGSPFDVRSIINC